MRAPTDRIAEHLNFCFGPEFAPADSFSLAEIERALEADARFRAPGTAIVVPDRDGFRYVRRIRELGGDAAWRRSIEDARSLPVVWCELRSPGEEP